jgi:bifunctional non-homologous end joining protein LigD
VLWPRTGTTKRQLIEFLLEIAPVLLPHVRGRGLTLGRWPEGVDATGWLQAECRGRPDWLPVHTVTTKAGGTFGYCMVEDRAGLAWLANLGTVELHPFLALAARSAEPSFLVFDLDPGPPASVEDCAVVALEIRDRLDVQGLVAYAKTSGALGLHLYVPLARGQTFDETKQFARRLAAELTAAFPERVTDKVGRAGRRGKVFIDWVQNDESRSTVAAYSPRATEEPLVSTPVTWDEVAAMASRHGTSRFGFREILARLDRLGDLFAPVLPDRTAGGTLPRDVGTADAPP